MKKVFIGGSRQIARLSAQVRFRLDNIIEHELPVLVGDAHGADKAVQRYLNSRGYRKVEVFHTNRECRNNLGEWVTHPVNAPKGARGIEYYSVKDEQMALECSIGFMIWDGTSRGTLANIQRLVEKNKKVVVYLAPEKRFLTIRDSADFKSFLGGRSKLSLKKRKSLPSLELVSAGAQTSLF